MILVNFWKKDYNDICFTLKEEKDLESMLSTLADIKSQYYIKFCDYLEKILNLMKLFIFYGMSRKNK